MSHKLSIKHSYTFSRNADKFVVRLPDGMRDTISDLAQENNRSMNSEIVSRLIASMAMSVQEDVGIAWVPSIGDLVTYNNQATTIKDFLLTDADGVSVKVLLATGDWEQLESIQPMILHRTR